MHCQFVCMLHILVVVLVVEFNAVVVGRDVVLTPKYGLQLNGKNIFYDEEDNGSGAQNQSLLRPWERTLKHVTYVTLFANDKADAATGNFSQQNAYNNFLHSPYLPQHGVFDTRFGDIVTLASGHLEKIGNDSFRFVEGQCGYDCEGDHVWALWQVQKIRHRDINRKFRYEMKFSVSPLRAESVGNVKRKAESDSNNSKSSTLQTYIQRDDDYPHTFGRIFYNDDSRFPDRRFDDVTGRNFMLGSVNQHRPATPMPQPTFLQSIYQPSPHFPSPDKLNIGEYIKDYPIKTAPKIKVFPNLLSTVSRNYYPAPTTYRPNYQTKFPRPELYPPTLEHETIKFPTNSNELNLADGVGKLSTPVVTHHFHHHFYMTSTTSTENELSSAEKPLNKQTNSHKSIISETTVPTSFNNYYNTGLKNSFQQGPQTVNPTNFPKTDTEVRKEHVVQVTPVAPLKRPYIYQMYQIPIDSKVPLLIYPGPVVEDELPLPRNKPFVQSEPMDENPIRYSEPDPLYLNLAHNPPLDGQSYELGASQLESPKLNQYTEYPDIDINPVKSRKVVRPYSTATQLPSPDSDQDERIPYEDESQEVDKQKIDLEQKSSQKDLQISFKNKQLNSNTETQMTSSTTASLIVADSSTPPATTTNTTTLSPTTKELLATTIPSLLTIALQTTKTMLSSTTAMPSTTSIDDATLPPKQGTQNFISTSTSETPSLRAISRYRLKHVRPSTTSTEQPVLKWKPRRKHSSKQSSPNNDVKPNSEINPAKENSAKTDKKRVLKEQNQRHENQLSTGLANNSTDAANNNRLPKKSSEVIEVLTQKSVSKSVSIKVGSNGEEIPVIVDDSDHGENEVKTE
ncbi:myb-like protein U [Bactrocera neohumeralis]|uniref:myb-like protein U n=1 Tax=Bactrocera neohumeralis TaxID=98809 RepID=UPI0021668E3B|nr:myb-like protein U [Bactrocera neohumeralis]